MITAFLSQPGLWFLIRQCRGLRSQALTKPVSLGPWHASPSPLAWKSGRGRRGGVWRATGKSSRASKGHRETRTPTLDIGFP